MYVMHLLCFWNHALHTCRKVHNVHCWLNQGQSWCVTKCGFVCIVLISPKRFTISISSKQLQIITMKLPLILSCNTALSIAILHDPLSSEMISQVTVKVYNQAHTQPLRKGGSNYFIKINWDNNFNYLRTYWLYWVSKLYTYISAISVHLLQDIT